jgi:hypothetical protein
MSRCRDNVIAAARTVSAANYLGRTTWAFRESMRQLRDALAALDDASADAGPRPKTLTDIRRCRKPTVR